MLRMLWECGVLLAGCLLVAVFPPAMARGPQGVPEDNQQEPIWEAPEAGRVVACGCVLQSPVVVGGRTGWRVVVWADYAKKESGQAHDWEKWLSFRDGKNGDAKADEDCREWRRALDKRREVQHKKAAEKKKAEQKKPPREKP